MRAAALTSVLLVACSFDWDAFDPRLGSGGAGAAASSAATGGASSSTVTTTASVGGSGSGGAAGGMGGGPVLDCPAAPGPTMVDIGVFCIDATEVTQSQYDQFLAAQVPPQSQSNDPLYCVWNTDYTASASPAGWPVNDVDWCDAQAYCRWAGKRLCGRIGGGANPLVDGNNAMFSEWHHVCTNGGANAFPYGDMPDTTACNTSEVMLGVQDVGTFPNCKGTIPPFDAVFDLSGNVHEWTNDCDGTAGEADICLIRGGGAPHTVSQSTCSDPYTVTRIEHFSDTGFRCCADSPP